MMKRFRCMIADFKDSYKFFVWNKQELIQFSSKLRVIGSQDSSLDDIQNLLNWVKVLHQSTVWNTFGSISKVRVKFSFGYMMVIGLELNKNVKQ